MATEQEGTYPAPGAGPGTAYGSVIREKGTRKVLFIAIGLVAVWYAYDMFRVRQLMAQTWPMLTKQEKPLVVTGLLSRYIAIERGRAWQIRIRDDAPAESSGSGSTGDQPTSEERQESAEVANREGNPGTGRAAARGAVVDVAEIIAKCPMVLTSDHFSSASMEKRIDDFYNRDYYVVNLQMTPEGRSRYWQYSRDHDGERLVFIMGKYVLTCPRIKHMDVSNFDINPVWDKADAEKLVNVINKR
jgi:hypothetical protein